MNGQELINYIVSNNLQNAKVYVACQGYTNYPEINDTNIEIEDKGNTMVICDNCVFDM